MAKLIKSMSSRTKNIIVGVIYTALVLLAVFPPLYFSASGNDTLILGAPIAVWYWIVAFLLLLVLMFSLFQIEKMRGEVDPALVVEEGGEPRC